MSPYAPARATRQHRSKYEYLHLREVLDTPYAGLPDAEIRSLMEDMYGPGSAEHYEEYFEGIFGDIGRAFSSAASDVGRAVQKAAPVIANVGGGVVQGALAGSSLGLPGIIAGAAAGGAGTALKSYGSGTARDIGGALSGLTGLAGQFSPLGRVGSAIGPAIGGLAGGGGQGAGGAVASALGGLFGGGGKPLLGGALGNAAISALAGIGGRSGAGGAAASALGGLLGGGGGRGAVDGAGAALSALVSLFGGSTAAGQLLSLLQRPETKLALAALKMPELGRHFVPTGSAQIPLPVTAVPNLIKQLTDQVVAEAAAFSDGAESEPRYMMDASGEWVGDPALDRDRAARVWDLLNVAQAERLVNALSVVDREAVDRGDEAVLDVGREERIVDFYDDIDLVKSYFLPTDDWEAELHEAGGEYLLDEDVLGENYGELEEGEPYEFV